MSALASPPAQPVPGMTCGGDPPAHILNPSSHSNCVSPELQKHVNRQSALNRRRLGLPAINTGGTGGALAGQPSAAPIEFSFFPMAGDAHLGDVVNGQFVDLDPTAATQDYLCRTAVGNGHAGTDCGLLTFAHQAIGVPVYAAADGVVVFAQDGFPDMNEFGSGELGNIVAIDHGAGPPHVETQYYHLKNGSVSVSVGQVVKAGRQIGMTGSSGNSFGPHLHFQTMVNGQVYEPFAGACREGPSAWLDQAALESNAMYLMDFGFTRTDVSQQTNPPWWGPWPIPTDGQFSTSDAVIRFYWQARNFPIDCPYRVRFFRPNNSLAAEYFFTWGNATVIQNMKSLSGFDFALLGPIAGTWRMEFLLNNQLMIDAPFEVINGSVDPDFNRPPETIAVAFDPPSPQFGDVVVCRVDSTQAREDLDWDIVRYRYVWKVNGITVRDVVNAVKSDAIPWNVTCSGATLTCTVTPNDGIIDGGSVQASVIVGGPHAPDLNCDGHVNVTDLLTVISTWGRCPAAPANCAGDANNDGTVNVTDLLLIISNWG